MDAKQGTRTRASGSQSFLTLQRTSGATPRRQKGGGERDRRRRRNKMWRRTAGARLGFGVGVATGGGSLNRAGVAPWRAGQEKRGGHGAGASAAGSDSSTSPARRRRAEEDDRWAPPVSDSERRKHAARAGAEETGCCWAAVGPRGAAKRARPGVRGPPADFGRRDALAGLGFKQKKIRGLF